MTCVAQYLALINNAAKGGGAVWHTRPLLLFVEQNNACSPKELIAIWIINSRGRETILLKEFPKRCALALGANAALIYCHGRTTSVRMRFIFHWERPTLIYHKIMSSARERSRNLFRYFFIWRNVSNRLHNDAEMNQIWISLLTSSIKQKLLFTHQHSIEKISLKTIEDRSCQIKFMIKLDSWHLFGCLCIHNFYYYCVC